MWCWNVQGSIPNIVFSTDVTLKSEKQINMLGVAIFARMMKFCPLMLVFQVHHGIVSKQCLAYFRMITHYHSMI